MLASQLPPVRRGFPTDYGELWEAFSLCYFARYSSQQAQLRPLTSYQRAWGFDNLKMFPRVSGSHPGWLMAIYSSTSQSKIIIAIEGAQSIADLSRYVGLLGAVSAAPFPGRIGGAYASAAQVIMSQLLADPLFVEATNHRSHTLTITGFSLGAAVAEVLAAKMLLADATRQITLKKFASPRVGNANWIDSGDPRIDRDSVYTSRDPIHAYPRFAFDTNFVGSRSALLYTTFFREQNARAIRPLSGWFEAVTDIPSGTQMMTVSRLRDADNPNNPWYHHHPSTYRIAFINAIQGSGINLDYFRMRYLEHNDENSWQQVQQPELGITAETQSVLAPAPDPFVIPPAYHSQIADSHERDTGASEVGGGDFGGSWEPDVGGGDWGYTSPNPTANRRRRRGAF